MLRVREDACGRVHIPGLLEVRWPGLLGPTALGAAQLRAPWQHAQVLGGACPAGALQQGQRGPGAAQAGRAHAPAGLHWRQQHLQPQPLHIHGTCCAAGPRAAGRSAPAATACLVSAVRRTALPLARCPPAQVKLEEASAASSSGRSSQLSFVDLAGSERAARTKNTGNRLKCVWPRPAGLVVPVVALLTLCLACLWPLRDARPACPPQGERRHQLVTDDPGPLPRGPQVQPVGARGGSRPLHPFPGEQDHPHLQRRAARMGAPGPGRVRVTRGRCGSPAHACMRPHLARSLPCHATYA